MRKGITSSLRVGKWLSPAIIMLLAFFTILPSQAQSLDTTGTWLRVNRGFAKCAENIGDFAGEAEWFTDDFDVQKLINRRGEMYAYISYGNDGTNTSTCEAGLFRHDTTTNRWIKVAGPIGTSKVELYTNNTDILATASYPFSNKVSMFSTDYANNPTGWREINPIGGFTGNSIPGLGCEGSGYQAYPDIIGYIGDTLFAYDEAPCDGPNQIVKLFVPQNRRINPATDYDVAVVGDLPSDGIAASFGRSSSNVFSGIVVTEPIGGVFQYFTRSREQGSIFSVPDYLWVYDPRTIPADQYAGMLPYRTDRAVMGGFVYYISDNGTDGFELWKPDGTTRHTCKRYYRWRPDCQQGFSRLSYRINRSQRDIIFYSQKPIWFRALEI